MSVLTTVTGDGTFLAPAAETGEDPHLAALTRLRALLGDRVDEQIGARMYLPAALGTAPTDHLLPSTLALLAEVSGDLASYGWRLGPGMGHAWRRARDDRERMVEAARIALFGFEGDLALTVLGPATLAGATFLPSGERTLSDPGAMRDLPHLLAEGISEHAALVRDRVPGARPRLLLREDAVGAIAAGLIPTPSGRRRYPAVPAPEIGMLWKCLLAGIATGTELELSAITLGVGNDIRLLTAARDAGATRFAVAPRRLEPLTTTAGRRMWEGLAAAHDQGCALELVVDPRPGGRMGSELDRVLETWRQLGYRDRDAAGLTLIAHTGSSYAVQAGQIDPAAQPDSTGLIDEPALTALLRAAPAWAERVAG